VQQDVVLLASWVATRSSASHTRATVMALDRLRVVVNVAARAQRDPEMCFDLFRYRALVRTVLSTQVRQQRFAIGQKIWFSRVLVTERADVKHITIVVRQIGESPGRRNIFI
jgi:hypothetical protein